MTKYEKKVLTILGIFYILTLISFLTYEIIGTS